MIFSPLFGWFGLAFVSLALLALCIIPLIRGNGPRWKWFVRIGVVVVLALALARPGIPVKSTTEEYEAAADVYFLVDTTSSMAAEDFDGKSPRLDGVKADMMELAKQFPGTRLSIITFASTASTVMPLTTDHAAFASAVDVLSPEPSMNSRGSSITEANAEFDKRLKSNREDRPDNKVFAFYFGDGEQTVSQQPESMAPFASQIDGGAVFGYGTAAGGKMKEHQAFGTGGLGDPNDPNDPGGQGTEDYIRDAQGNPGISKIDETNLKNVATQLKVDYHLRDGKTPMSSAFTAPKFEQTLVKKDGRVTVDEYFWVPLILVFLWIAIEMVFGIREFSRLRNQVPKRGSANWQPPGSGPGPAGPPTQPASVPEPRLQPTQGGRQ